jgi:CsoR family transcriptional regulator, copper-sensing transcriptional repressor
MIAHMHMDDATRAQILTRLRRIEGQVRGIARMVEDDKYCVDILDQVTAATAALDRVGVGLLGNHVRGCVRDAVSTPAGEEKVEELIGVISRFLKT